MTDLDRDPGMGTPARRRRRLPAFVLAAPGRLRNLAARLDFRGVQLGSVFERELEAGRGFLWFPVLFGVGIGLYFALPVEPSFLALALLTAALAASAVGLRRNLIAFRTLAALALVAAGAATMKHRTDAAAAPVVPREMTVTVSGWVAEREAIARTGARFLLRVADMSRLPPDEWPRFVRVSVRSGAADFMVGDAVTLRARIQPPTGPVLPGGYDFARDAFFEGTGAVGFAYGSAKPAELGPAPLGLRLLRPLGELRETIRARIVAAIPGDGGRIAAALVMGDQRAISEATQEDMRASGLGHILSISGLHLALVAGAVFWVVLALLALSPSLALQRPIRKWAAAAALGVATFYLGISGAEVATVRSWVMLAVMLVAVMADRRAITLRNVAFAGFAILLIMPESLLSVSFQMSFAATIAIVAAYEALAERRAAALDLRDATERGWAWRAQQTVFTLTLTSLVAGLATAPFGAFHFQRVAPLTLIANLAAAPAVGVLVMPMALAAVLLMPFGVEHLPLALMDLGLDWVRFVASETAAWSEGLGGVRAMPLVALLLAVAGFLWLALWRERWRYAGLVPMVAALPFAVWVAVPEVIVGASGTVAAVRGGDGLYRIVADRRHNFEVGMWLRADADLRDLDDPTLQEGIECDGRKCIGSLGDGRRVAVVFFEDAFATACARAAVVVSRLRAPAWCADKAMVLDRPLLRRGGSAALYTDATARGGFRAEAAYPDERRAFMPPVRP